MNGDSDGAKEGALGHTKGKGSGRRGRTLKEQPLKETEWTFSSNCLPLPECKEADTKAVQGICPSNFGVSPSHLRN